jgi:hypothetical protein
VGQLLHADHVCWQSCFGGKSWHSTVFFLPSSAHFLPHLFGTFVIMKDIVDVPLPHVFEHLLGLLHLPSQFVVDGVTSTVSSLTFGHCFPHALASFVILSVLVF